MDRASLSGQCIDNAHSVGSTTERVAGIIPRCAALGCTLLVSCRGVERSFGSCTTHQDYVEISAPSWASLVDASISPSKTAARARGDCNFHDLSALLHGLYSPVAGLGDTLEPRVRNLSLVRRAITRFKRHKAVRQRFGQRTASIYHGEHLQYFTRLT